MSHRPDAEVAQDGAGSGGEGLAEARGVEAGGFDQGHGERGRMRAQGDRAGAAGRAIGQVTDLFALGDEIEVEVVSIEPDSVKIRLSRKPLLSPPTEEELAKQRSRADEPRRQRRQPRVPARDRGESDE